MRRLWKRFEIDTDLIIGDSISNIIHEFRYSLNILIVFRVIHSLDSTQHLLKLVLHPIEGARKESVQGWLGRGRGNRHEQVRSSHRLLRIDHLIVLS